MPRPAKLSWPGPRPLVIAHRGASAYLAEHTLEAYAAGHLLGADYVEPDVVATRDGVLICNHDVELEQTSDVARVYPDRARADGHSYAFDFTLDEIRRLRRVDRRAGGGLDDLPPGGSPIPTLEEMIALVQRLNSRTGRNVGVIPELKKPALHGENGIDVAAIIAGVLAKWRYRRRRDAAIVQCFEWETLQRLKSDHNVELRLLALTNADSVSEDDLDQAAKVADAIGPKRSAIEASGGRAFVDAAHERGLATLTWTFEEETEEMRGFFHELGVDGIFANDPAACRVAADTP